MFLFGITITFEQINYFFIYLSFKNISFVNFIMLLDEWLKIGSHFCDIDDVVCENNLKNSFFVFSNDTSPSQISRLIEAH